MATRNRARLYFGMRNYKFETHDAEGRKVDNITEDEWKQKVSEELESAGAVELTYIFHDNDFDGEGQKKALHVHFVARFSNPVSYEATLAKFKCEKRNFEKARSEASALLYLTHTSVEAIKAKKTRYNVSKLNVLLFEDEAMKRLKGEELEKWYRVKIAGKSANNKANTDDEVARIIDELAEGTLVLTDVKEELKQLYDSTTATMTWMKNKRYFKEAVAEYYQSKYLDWLDKGRSFKLIYIEGQSGIGKTVFAREIAKMVNKSKNIRESLIHNAPNDSKGTRYDFLNGYEQEAVTVFDDLNPTTFGYTEFLNLFEKERVAKYSSRFNDKAWFAEVAIITKSTPIDVWTHKLAYSEWKTSTSNEDRFNILYQPRRRFSLVIKLEDDKVTISNYKVIDKKTNKHELVIDEIFDCSKCGFYDNKFQKKVLEAIATRLGLEEASEKDIAELEKVEVNKESIEKLSQLALKLEVENGNSL